MKIYTGTSSDKQDTPGGSSSVEDKVQTCIEDERVTNQVIAQTIVFSFLQRKQHSEYEQFLIPSVAVSRKEIIFYFYDSQYDILLRSPAFPLFVDDGMSMAAILCSWFVMNYKYLCSGVTEGMITAPKANFFEFAGKQLHVYKENLALGNISVLPERRLKFVPWVSPVGIDNSEPYVKKRKMEKN